MLICVDNFRVVMCLIICCICDGYPTKKKLKLSALTAVFKMDERGTEN